mmetsp:Transcript_22382/g.68164  ORF Transcript_22382/g.68164 Transcript_22382/m.68164 type:complete len:240 (+) Transcript_22382:1039-1758(+)
MCSSSAASICLPRAIASVSSGLMEMAGTSSSYLARSALTNSSTASAAAAKSFFCLSSSFWRSRAAQTDVWRESSAAWHSDIICSRSPSSKRAYGFFLMPITFISPAYEETDSSSLETSVNEARNPSISATCCSASETVSTTKISVRTSMRSSILWCSASAFLANSSRMLSIICWRSSSSRKTFSFSTPRSSRSFMRCLITPVRLVSENWRIGGQPSSMILSMSLSSSGTVFLRPASSSS